MPINFPTGPTSGQQYTFGARTWSWNGSAWDAITTTYGPTGPTGATGANSTVAGPTGPTGSKGDSGYLVITSNTEPATPVDGLIWVNTNANIDAFTAEQDLINKIIMEVF
jgi:hypothetical protein